MKLKLYPFLVYLISLTTFSHIANGSENLNTNNLGTIEVVAPAYTNSFIDNGGSIIKADDAYAKGNMDVASTAQSVPGVNLSASGARNEKTLYVRGFDLRQVPFLIDGIPVYLPYDGNVDLGRFTSSDISQIEISKGNASNLIGANVLGGVINVVTQKPTKKFEASSNFGTKYNNSYEYNGLDANLKIASKQEKFYYMLVGQTNKHEETKISKNFKSAAVSNPLNHSRTSDRKGSVKIGFTPNTDSEYTLNYSTQHGNKDVPTYAGNDPSIQKRYWTYPVWDKQSLYFISSNKFLNRSLYLKSRLFYDKLQNTLESYDDATYSTQTRNYAFTSYYDDDAFGGALESGYYFSNSILKNAFHWKQDQHKEHGRDEPIRHFTDDTFSLGIENTFLLPLEGELAIGANYDWRRSKKAEDYNSTTDAITDFEKNDNQAFNPQIGYTVQILPSYLKMHASIAKKTRFPTMKDRYSYRMQTAYPNPHLKQEKSIVYELGSIVTLNSNFKIKNNLFFYDVDDTLQSINVETNKTQIQNVGRSNTKGIEIEFNFSPITLIDINGNYTYLKKTNKSSQTYYFIDTPKHSAHFNTAFKLSSDFIVTPSFEYSSERYSNSTGTQYVAGTFLTSLHMSYTAHQNVTFNIGVKNITDRYYELTSGYPEEGRTFYINADCRL